MKKKENGLKMSINSKLGIAFLLALLIPSLLISFTSFFVSKGEIQHQIYASAKQSVATVDDFVNKHVNPIVHDVEYFSKTIKPDQLKLKNRLMLTKSLEQYFETSDGLVSAFIGTESGEMIQFPDLGLSSDPNFDPRERDWYISALKSPNQVVISDPHESASTKELVVTVSKKLADGGGVFAVNLEMKDLSSLISSITVGKKGYPILVNSHQEIITHPSIKAGANISREEWAKKMFETDQEIFDYFYKGEPKQMFVKTNKLTNWKIGGTMPTDEITTATKPILTSTLFAVVISLLLFGIFLVAIIRSITKPLKSITDAAIVMSSGDLRAQVDIHKNDEIGILGKSFQQMGNSLSTVISHIHEKSALLLASSEKLSATTEENSKATEQISSSMITVKSGLKNQTEKLQESFHSLKTVSNDIQQIYQNTNQVTLKAKDAEETVDIGYNVVFSTQEQMKTIENSINNLSVDIETVNSYAREINEIVNVITAISEQTNLLALNAAIEAARAGEQGKGFAVVAEEVRKLAEQTNNSSVQVKEIITAIQRESSKSVDSMNTSHIELSKGLEMFVQTETNFKEVKQFIEEITSQLQNVLKNAQKIAQNSEQVVNDMTIIEEISNSSKVELEHVTAATEEQMYSMEEIASTAESLEKAVEELQCEVQTFKLP